jgi:hypothetical protein
MNQLITCCLNALYQYIYGLWLGIYWGGMHYQMVLKALLSFFLFSRGDKRNGKLVFLFGVVSWTIWLNRNDLVFNSKSIATPRALIFKLISFL